MTDWERIPAPDWERLSAYLDGELPPPEASRLEARLRDEAGLRQALQELRATVQALRTLPAADPPRDFRLTEQVARQRRGGLRARMQAALGGMRVYPVLQLSTALAALALVSVVGFDVLVNDSLAGYRLDRRAAAPLANAELAQGTGSPEAEGAAPLLMAEQSVEAPAEADAEMLADEAEAGMPAEEVAADAATEEAKPAAEQEPPRAPASEGQEQDALAEDQGVAAGQAEDEIASDQQLGAAALAAEAQALEALDADALAQSAQPAARQRTVAGRIALTVAEIGLAAATLLLLAFTLRERRRA